MAIFEAGTITAVGSVLQRPDHRSGSTFTLRATATTSSGPVDVAVKSIAGRRLANEVAAAWVATKLRLPMVANVLLVDDPQGMLDAAAGQPIGGGISGRWLATRFSPLPIFSTPQDYSDLQALTRTQEFQEIIIFDVLIANTDRVDRNLLWSSAGVCVFDHDKAFSGENWTVTTLSRDVATTPIGLFETNISFADQAGRDAIVALANKWVAVITDADAADLDELARLGVIGDIDIEALKTFIVARSANFPALVLDVVNRN